MLVTNADRKEILLMRKQEKNCVVGRKVIKVKKKNTQNKKKLTSEVL